MAPTLLLCALPLTLLHCGPDRGEDSPTAPPTDRLVVEVVHPATGEGVEGITVIHGYDLDAVKATSSTGRVTLDGHESDMPVTLIWTDAYDFGGSSTTQIVRTFVGLNGGDVLTVPWQTTSESLNNTASIQVTGAGFQLTSESDLFAVLSYSDLGILASAVPLVSEAGSISTQIATLGEPYLVAGQLTESRVVSDGFLALPDRLGVLMDPPPGAVEIPLDVEVSRLIAIDMSGIDVDMTHSDHRMEVVIPNRASTFFNAPSYELSDNDSGFMRVPNSVEAFGAGSELRIMARVTNGRLTQEAAHQSAEPTNVNVSFPPVPQYEAQGDGLSVGDAAGAVLTVSGAQGAQAMGALYTTTIQDDDQRTRLRWAHLSLGDDAILTFPQLPDGLAPESFPSTGTISLGVTSYYGDAADLAAFVTAGGIELPGSYQSAAVTDSISPQ